MESWASVRIIIQPGPPKITNSTSSRLITEIRPELHVSLSAAVPNARYVEYIPQLRSLTHAGLEIIDGEAIAPTTQGLGIDWDFDALDRNRTA